MSFPFTFPFYFDNWKKVGSAYFSVEIAFSTDPGATPTWSDVGSKVRKLSFRRGRQHELGRIEAGTAMVVLDNTGGDFDPTHAGGIYYPNVLPLRCAGCAYGLPTKTSSMTFSTALSRATPRSTPTRRTLWCRSRPWMASRRSPWWS